MYKNIWGPFLLFLGGLSLAGCPKVEDCATPGDEDENGFADCADAECQNVAVCVPQCGNGVQDAGEGCDDGNTTSNDGCSAACQIEACGDGILQQGEECEDGNAQNGDGCSSGCLFENPGDRCGNGNIDAGETCDDGNTNNNDGCSANCQTEECGDGVLQPGEECEDGNNQNGDGCDAACQFENAGNCGNGSIDVGEGCDDGNTQNNDGCSFVCQVEFCGDGILQQGETCEDGNTQGGDGCSADCQFENLADCGNGLLDAGEECDDGNNAIGDGCSSLCLLEQCGNGILDFGEQCDDGNAISGDGCEPDCRVGCGNGVIDPIAEITIPASEVVALRFEYLVTGCGATNNLTFAINGVSAASPNMNLLCSCTPGIESFTTTDPALLAALSDGANNLSIAFPDPDAFVSWALVVALDANGQELDLVIADIGSQGDAIARDLDLCGPNFDEFTQGPGQLSSQVTGITENSFEQCDDGNQIDGDGCASDCTTEICGDGDLDGNEECDDGNTQSGDGCSFFCTFEICGDGLIDAGEECDDGNNDDGDGCSSICVIEGCGDGVVQNNEECDDGNGIEGDGCDSNCTLTACGNTITDPTEECDDGNNDDGDGCSAACILEICGNALIEGGEECDDGNLTSGDGCDSNCRITGCGNGAISAGEECDDSNQDNGDGCDQNCQVELFSLPIFEDFDDDVANGFSLIASSPNAQWQVDGFRSVSAPNSLYFGNPVTRQYDDDPFVPEGSAFSPAFTVPSTGAEINFDLIKDTESGGFDVLTVFLTDVSLNRLTTLATIDISTGLTFQSRLVIVGTGFGGQDVRVEFNFDAGDTVANNTEGVYIDDLLIDELITNCGDGNVEAGEECDDGNLNDGDGCDSLCSLEVCGDGQLDFNEECDDANLISGDGCDQNCTLTACGNGVTSSGETCDDGNQTSGDGCDQNCQIEVLSLPIFEDFDDDVANGFSLIASSPNAQWQVDGFRSVSAPNSLYFGNPVTRQYDDDPFVPEGSAFSPAFTVPAAGATVTFDLFKDTEVSTTFDVLTVSLTDIAGNTLATLGTFTNNTGGVFIGQTVSISNSFAGQDVRVEFNFDASDTVANNTEGVYIDNLDIN